MPELPEVENVARCLADRIQGLVVKTARLSRPEMLHGDAGPIEGLVGCRIQCVRRAGKQVEFVLEGRRRRPAPAMFVHLGMTGNLLVADKSDDADRHIHLRIAFRETREELRFRDPRRFGGIWLIAHESSTRKVPAPWIGRRHPPIGADPFSLSLPALQRILNRRRQIKALLLDQDPITGLGNIYCDELLHRAGIHPLTCAADLDPAAVRRLREAMRRVLQEAIRAGGSSISDYRAPDSTRGTYQERHRVYGRAGRPCGRCTASIERLVVAGRGTYLCPRCQPHP